MVHHGASHSAPHTAPHSAPHSAPRTSHSAPHTAPHSAVHPTVHPSLHCVMHLRDAGAAAHVQAARRGVRHGCHRPRLYQHGHLDASPRATAVHRRHHARRHSDDRIGLRAAAAAPLHLHRHRVPLRGRRPRRAGQLWRCGGRRRAQSPGRAHDADGRLRRLVQVRLRQGHGAGVPRRAGVARLPLLGGGNPNPNLNLNPNPNPNPNPNSNPNPNPTPNPNP